MLAAGLGGLAGLGQAPFSLIWIAYPALVAILYSFGAMRPGSTAFWQGWATGVGYAVVSMNWITAPFLVDIARHGWMAPFALFFMASGFGVFWGGAFWAARRVAQTRATAPLALALTWSGAEMMRSYILTGFPWGLVSYIWIDTPVLQFSSVLGPHGLTLATLLSAALLGHVWRSGRRGGGVATALVLGLVFWGGGYLIETRPILDAGGPRPVVRLIQPNAPQDQKWDPAMMPVFYARQIELTSAPSQVPPDLVVWPEVAVPFLLNEASAPFWEISGAAGGVPVALGLRRLQGANAYNSIGVLGAGGEVIASYDKSHLVPFGEYLPLSGLMTRFGVSALAAQFGRGFSAGDGPKVIDLGALGKTLPMICYEAIFPNELRRVSERPDWMLQVTNDAWFGDFSGPYQHLAQARARSVELGLPMVRVANTGVSAVIDARGKILDSLPLGQAGFLDVPLPTPLPPTIYAKSGDLPAFLLILLGLATVFARRIRLTRA